MFFYVSWRGARFASKALIVALLQKVMTRSVSLHPSFFGKNFQQTLERKLKADCEGVWSETYGFIVLVADVTSFGKGKVQDETGHAVFTLKFNALVFRVSRREKSNQSACHTVVLVLKIALSRRGAGRSGESDQRARLFCPYRAREGVCARGPHARRLRLCERNGAVALGR